MQRRLALLVWGGVLTAGVLLLLYSVLFLTRCGGLLTLGVPCTLELHWPSIVPAGAMIALAGFMMIRTIRAPRRR